VVNQNIRLNNHIIVDQKTAQKLFAEYDPRARVAGLQLVPEGMSTSNYIIDIQNDSRKFLLKIYPEGGGNSALEVSSYQYAKQYVNVPDIYLFDKKGKVIDSPYVIMDYVDGMTLREYVIHHQRFPEKIAHDIGSKLALLHQREYETMALLDENLDIQKVLLPVTTLHEYCLNGIAGTRIRSETKNDVLEFISENRDMLKELALHFVYSHGDFNPSNILIDHQDNVWFIDFEYSLAAPVYYDIGKFFRGRAELDQYIGKSVYDHFGGGYNAIAKQPVPEDWIKLAKLMDIAGMLELLNKEKVPEGWREAIELEILGTMSILKK
jgi:tRNA A-37 threonylcarbamoyl transferase component Bud32